MAVFLYLGTEEGVVVLSSPDRRDWKIENQALGDWSVTSLAVTPSAPQRAYAATRGDGVWSTDDFGRHWRKPCYGKPGPGKARSVSIDPHDPHILYAGAEPLDLFVSEDEGNNWRRLDSIRKVPRVESITYPVPTVEPHIRDIAVDPKDKQKIYVALQVGYLLKTTDGGRKWRLLDKGLDADVHTIQIDPENTEKLIVATGGHDSREGRVKGRALYMSDDGGENWEPTAMNFSQEYSVPLVRHPKNHDMLYSALAHGHPGLWGKRPSGPEAVLVRTQDRGRTWNRVDGKTTGLGKKFFEAIAIDDVESHFLYAASHEGDVYLSDDEGSGWGKLDIQLPAVKDLKAVTV